MDSQYNTQNPAVKRLMREALELKQPTELFSAAPLEDNLFEWHFTIRGPVDSDFDGGIFHGRITMPPDYPMKPPSIILLTPNGRFETNKKVCLSISGHHPESWQPSWSIRTALLAIIGFMPSPAAGAVGSMDLTPTQRQALAKKSLSWYCASCNLHMRDALAPLTDASSALRDEAKQLGRHVSKTSEKNDQSSVTDRAEGGEEEFDQQSPVEGDNAAPPLNLSRQVVQEELRRRLMQRAGGRTPPFTSSSGSSSGLERRALDIVLTLLCLMLIALVLRRLYIQNEWRFYQ